MEVGDKVVYIGGNLNPDVTTPKINTEVVTIKGVCSCGYCENHFIIEEYQFSLDGDSQVFCKTQLRKLITDHTESFESSELSRKLANKPLIKEGVEKTKTKENAEH